MTETPEPAPSAGDVRRTPHGLELFDGTVWTPVRELPDEDPNLLRGGDGT